MSHLILIRCGSHGTLTTVRATAGGQRETTIESTQIVVLNMQEAIGRLHVREVMGRWAWCAGNEGGGWSGSSCGRQGTIDSNKY
jgi:hypothetical protein